MTDQYIINNPQFIQQSVSQSFLKPVGDDVVAAYAYPFPTPESKRAAVDMGDSLPIAGQPANTFRLATGFNTYLSTMTTPKLALYGDSWFRDAESGTRPVHLAQSHRPARRLRRPLPGRGCTRYPLPRDPGLASLVQLRSASSRRAYTSAYTSTAKTRHMRVFAVA